MKELADRFAQETTTLPWFDLISQRTGSFDSSVEDELIRRRAQHFYPASRSGDRP